MGHPGPPAPGESVVGLSRWQDLIRERFVALDIRTPDDGRPLRGSIGAVRTVGSLAVATVRSDAQTFRRTPGLIDRYGEDVLQVGLVRRGAAWLEQDGRRCRLGPGSFAVYDASRPFTWTMRGSWAMDVLTWPRRAVPLDDRRARTVTAAGLGSGLTGQVARAALEQLGGLDGDVGGAEGAVLASRVADLVLSAASRPGAAGDPRIGPVLDFIELHLRDPALTPDHVARRFHLSRRSLQRLFADQPRGVADWIRYRRLDRARSELVDAPRTPVAAVAARYCFSTPTVFARAFRAEFGCSPHQVRRGDGNGAERRSGGARCTDPAGRRR